LVLLRKACRRPGPGHCFTNLHELTTAQTTGKLGEDIACRHLQKKGYQILERNWRRRRAEIDIIAKDGDALVFIEVKTRSSDFYGKPSAFFSPKQASLISTAASLYMEEINYDWEVRFDLVSILLDPQGNYQLEHIEDAYFPGLSDF
jgi:putative endonuclease